MSKPIKLVARDSFIINAADAPGYERGPMGKGKPKVARAYSVYRIEGDIALCQSKSAIHAGSKVYEERLSLKTLIAHTPSSR